MRTVIRPLTGVGLGRASNQRSSTTWLSYLTPRRGRVGRATRIMKRPPPARVFIQVGDRLRRRLILQNSVCLNWSHHNIRYAEDAGLMLTRPRDNGERGIRLAA